MALLIGIPHSQNPFVRNDISYPYVIPIERSVRERNPYNDDRITVDG
jgi:hypothetical protein